jgi:hypothetical protein
LARSIPSVVQTDLESATPSPIWLVQIPTGTSPATLYYTSREHDVSFGGVTYSARGHSHDGWRFKAAGDGSSIDLRLADLDGAFNTLLAAGAAFEGKRVVLIRTVEAAIGAGSDYANAIHETFIVESVRREQGTFVLRLVFLMTWIFDLDLPRDRNIIDRSFAPGIPLTGTPL